MEDREKEFFPDPREMDEYIPEGGFELEEILKEDFSDGIEPEESESSRRDAAVTPPPVPETPSIPEKEARADFPGETSDEDDFHVPDDPEGDDAEEGSRIKIPNIPVRVLGLLAAVALAAVLVCVAVRFDLAGAARTALEAAGIALACAPMAVMSLDVLREKDRVPAPLIMALAVIILAVSGDVIEALVSAVFFDLCEAAMGYFFRHELALLESRLETKSGELDKPLVQRLETIVREVSYGRVRPIVRGRAMERLVVFGVLALAAVISVIVPLVDGMSFAKWVGRGGAVLGVCVFSGEAGVLLTFLNAAYSAAGEGIYYSGSAAISAAAQVTSVLFNKSGTLTDRNYRVVNVDPVRLSNEQLLYLAVCAGAWSDHPLARAIREYAGTEPDRSLFSRHTERDGYGSMVSLRDGQIVAAGNIDFMEELGVRGDMYIPGETCVFVAVGKICVGRIDLADELKSDAVTVVHELRRLKVVNVALMTGDNALNATNTGRRLGIAEVYSDCRPKDKVERLQYILDSQERDDRLMVVSSSGQDREILEMANLSVILGMGDDITDAYPDIVITSGKLADLTRALRISKRVQADLTAGFAAASVLRITCLVLALAGVLGLWGVTALMLAAGLVTFLASFVSEK